MTTAPATRRRLWSRYAHASTSAVRPTYHAARSVVRPDGGCRPTMVAGSRNPATTLRLLLVSAVLRVAAPRPFAAR